MLNYQHIYFIHEMLLIMQLPFSLRIKKKTQLKVNEANQFCVMFYQCVKSVPNKNGTTTKIVMINPKRIIVTVCHASLLIYLFWCILNGGNYSIIFSTRNMWTEKKNKKTFGINKLDYTDSWLYSMFSFKISHRYSEAWQPNDATGAHDEYSDCSKWPETQ